MQDFCKKSVVSALEFLDTIEFTEKEKIISAEIVKEIRERLNFLRVSDLAILRFHVLQERLAAVKVSV